MSRQVLLSQCRISSSSNQFTRKTQLGDSISVRETERDHKATAIELPFIRPPQLLEQGVWHTGCRTLTACLFLRSYDVRLVDSRYMCQF